MAASIAPMVGMLLYVIFWPPENPSPTAHLLLALTVGVAMNMASHGNSRGNTACLAADAPGPGETKGALMAGEAESMRAKCPGRIDMTKTVFRLPASMESCPSPFGSYDIQPEYVAYARSRVHEPLHIRKNQLMMSVRELDSKNTKA